MRLEYGDGYPAVPPLVAVEAVRALNVPVVTLFVNQAVSRRPKGPAHVAAVTRKVFVTQRAGHFNAVSLGIVKIINGPIINRASRVASGFRDKVDEHVLTLGDKVNVFQRLGKSVTKSSNYL